MSEHRHASTAYWIAAARARESARPDALFHDPFSAPLAGPRGFAMLERQEQLASRDNPFLAVRTRYFDDVLVAASSWIRQVVLLSAGFDTRAFRMPLDPEIAFYELDHAEIFDIKEHILKAYGASVDRPRKTVAVDLTGSWSDRLREAGFDPSLATLWLAEGLFFYLREDEVEWVLRQAAACTLGAGMLGADLFGTGLLKVPSMQPYFRQLKQSQQPLPFCTDDPEGLLRGAGWPGVSMVRVGQEGANYGRIALREGAPDDASMRAYLVLGKRE